VKRRELTRKISKHWPNLVQYIYASDSEYADGIKASDVHKYWHRWKYGFLGFGGAPLYHEEGQDCDDLVRDFIVRFRAKYREDNKALPIFFTGSDGHAYASYLNESGEINTIDLRDGKLYPIEAFVLEML